jgi:hypothetical protein
MPEGRVRRKQKVVISKEARELFIRSHLDSDSIWLRELLKRYETVYETDFEDTLDFDKERVNYVLNVFPEVIKSLGRQWFRASDEMVVKNGTCELCGKRRTKYMYEIKNRLNGSVMMVGSTCVWKFDTIDQRLPSGMSLLFSPLIDLEKILLSAIIQIRGKFHDKKRLYARIQRTDIKGMPRGRECCCCRQTA